MSNTNQVSTVAYANNTDADLSMFHLIIMDAIKNGITIDEDFSDLFTLNIVQVADGVRGIINWA
jgi:hypothetical protein